ncbi:hypothetical protein BDA96_07G214100 [Sorghum bicolor]|uniref:Uncharacterized protein n=2 Tax=Sorghum bicolor TaxID=4558 RepID=A0A921QM06_SORBI|nr:hypothetical protein BDA96_07G214100 [Sorghum bicolor]OQU80870.1 hypothetical protein SORBI_3007G201450 [Sorghum bicolor]
MGQRSPVARGRGDFSSNSVVLGSGKSRSRDPIQIPPEQPAVQAIAVVRQVVWCVTAAAAAADRQRSLCRIWQTYDDRNPAQLWHARRRA